MLMDTLKGEQRNEAPIKSNRVPFYIISILHEMHVQLHWARALQADGVSHFVGTE